MHLWTPSSWFRQGKQAAWSLPPPPTLAHKANPLASNLFPRMLSKSKIRVNLHPILHRPGEQRGMFDGKKDGNLHKRDVTGLYSTSATHLWSLVGAGGQRWPRVKREIVELPFWVDHSVVLLRITEGRAGARQQELSRCIAGHDSSYLWPQDLRG